MDILVLGVQVILATIGFGIFFIAWRLFGGKTSFYTQRNGAEFARTHGKANANYSDLCNVGICSVETGRKRFSFRRKRGLRVYRSFVCAPMRKV